MSQGQCPDVYSQLTCSGGELGLEKVKAQPLAFCDILGRALQHDKSDR